MQNKEYTCCFTGHRPDKLDISENEVKKLLREAIQQAIRDGYTTFISGGSIGVDLWAAEIVIEEKENNPNIQLILAIPHPNFERKWDKSDKKLYQEILDKADEVNILAEHYFRSCYQFRNSWMVDRSSLVIAAYNGAKGGTQNTIKYAEKKDIPIRNVLVWF